MQMLRYLCAALLFFGACAENLKANWLTYAGGPAVAIGTWPAGSGLNGTATVTASNFFNGNNSTPLIGLTPINIGPPLSADFFAAGLQPNLGNIVPMIGTPYNDAGDRYHVVIDFSGTTGGSTSGVLPAGTVFALVDLDIQEDYRRISATNALNVPIVTPWIAGPNGYFDMTPPMIPQGSLIPNPTLVGPIAGIYDMFGVSYNFDVGMWLFQTTQDVRTISFDMQKSTGGNAIGGGGAGLGFLFASAGTIFRRSRRLRNRCTRLWGSAPRSQIALLRSSESDRRLVRSTAPLFTRQSLPFVSGELLMKRNRRIATLISGMSVLVALLLVGNVAADPIPGRDILKFSQAPMDGTQILSPNGTVQRFWGHDELSTAYSSVSATGPTPYRGTFMADDFADKFNSPIVHVKWWGSYLNNFVSPSFPVDKFLISIESDVPVGPNNPFSHPGTPLLNQIVNRGPIAPGSGTFTEKPISGGGPPLGETLYEYNAELHLGAEFFQKADTVYWLKVVALVDLPPGITIDPNQPPTFVPRWGWHNRDFTKMDPLASTAPAVVPGEHIDGFLGPVPGGTPVWHFQDDAVTGNVVVNHLITPDGIRFPIIDQAGYQPTRYLDLADGPPGIGNFSKDLAFELYTVPEPTSAALLAVGALAFVGLRWRRGAQAR